MFIALTVQGLAMGMVYAVLSIGLLLIVRAAKILNLAQGDLLTIGAFTTCLLAAEVGLTTIPMIAVAFILFCAYGVIFYFTCIWPLRNSKLGFLSMIATIGASTAIKEICILVAGPTPRPAEPLIPGLLKIGDITLQYQYLLIAGTSVVLMLLVYLLFEKLYCGRVMQAAAQDRYVAPLMGISTVATTLVTFIVVMVISGFGGWLVAPTYAVSITLSGLAMKSFAGVVLGGFGNIRGAIIGSVLIGFVESYSSYVTTTYKDVIVFSVLYNNVLNHDPGNPQWNLRDRFILSKGHVCPAIYAVLADCGYFNEEELMTLRKYGSILQGHPYMHKTPGIEVSSGSLGQGLSIAVGIALAARMDGSKIRTYCLMGDGEMQEGQIWEAAMAAGHYKLDNLCGIVDKNGLQIDGNVENVMDIDPIAEKLAAFKWNVIETDGHDVAEIEEAFGKAKEYKGKPTVIIAHTVKGKGVSFMENNPEWHGVAPNREQLAAALNELERGNN